jgi:hypothetical protein
VSISGDMFRTVIADRIETWKAIVEMYEREGLEPDPGIVAELNEMQAAAAVLWKEEGVTDADS